MNKLDPSKLYVEMRDNVTSTEPLLGRRYTLTHSDITAELFLVIGRTFADDMLNEMRDEVIAEWRNDQYRLYLIVQIPVDNQPNLKLSEIRNAIFRRELPLALEAIRYGDSQFFDSYPELKQAQILINFDSIYSKLDCFEYWGILDDYK